MGANIAGSMGVAGGRCEQMRRAAPFPFAVDGSLIAAPSDLSWPPHFLGRRADLGHRGHRGHPSAAGLRCGPITRVDGQGQTAHGKIADVRRHGRNPSSSPVWKARGARFALAGRLCEVAVLVSPAWHLPGGEGNVDPARFLQSRGLPTKLRSGPASAKPLPKSAKLRYLPTLLLP